LRREIHSTKLPGIEGRPRSVSVHHMKKEEEEKEEKEEEKETKKTTYVR
jgi:hypothetical protein